MAYFKLLIAAFFLLAGTAFAGYQAGRPPPGWNPGNPPAYKPAPGEFYDLDKRAWMTLTKVNTGGGELTVPVRLPLLPAVEVGLAFASAFSANPAILVATAAFALYNHYLSQKGITAHDDGTFTQVDEGAGCDLASPAACYEYTTAYNNSIWGTSKNSVCQSSFAKWALQQYGSSATGSASAISITQCQATGSYQSGSVRQGFVFGDKFTLSRRVSTTAPTVVTKLITPSQVSTEMAPLPMPSDLAKGMPYPHPVGDPVMNPGPAGTPQVLRVPMGSPVAVPLPNPNPDNLPQTWKTPVVDIIPSPTPDDPWRVETVPKDITKVDPAPLPDPFNPNPSPSPLPTPVPVPNDPGTTEAPADRPGLCEEYPDILACSKPEFDTPEEDELPTVDKDISINPQGFGGGGSCPAPRHLSGANVDFEFTLLCDGMSMLRPILIAVAWLVAGLILLGVKGSSD